jgi:hypothetical protein
LGLGTEQGHLKIGRFAFFDGGELAPKNATLAALKGERVAQRLIGDFGFSDVGRSFDGAQYSYAPSGSNNITVVAAVPTRAVFQVDGCAWNRVGFGYAAYTHDWGTGRHAADRRLFAVEYDDWRHVVKTDSRPLVTRSRDMGNIRINTLGVSCHATMLCPTCWQALLSIFNCSDRCSRGRLYGIAS